MVATLGLGIRVPRPSPPGFSATATSARATTAGPVFSDFNGDGFPDQAIGAPSEDLGSLEDAGAVNVLYGSATGLQTDAPADQFWTQDSTDLEDQAESGDRFGFALVGADFNGDGFADLAIGAPSEDLPAGRNAGAVNVLYGSSAGLQVTSPEDQFWNQDSPDVQDEAAAEERFGRSLGAGDFNGDGYADLAIGVPYQVMNGRKNAGAASVLYGSPAGLQATSPDDQFWNQDSPDVEDQAEERDWFGWSLAPGDFNGDGFADLAIGDRVEDVGAVVDAGAVNVLYGSVSGLQATAPEDQFWTEDSADVEDQAETDDEFGWSVDAADFNLDGFQDLIIGVPLQDVSTIADAGAAHVLYGSAAGLQTAAPEDQFWTQGSLGVDDQAEVGDEFGDSFTGGAQCYHPCHSPFP